MTHMGIGRIMHHTHIRSHIQLQKPLLWADRLLMTVNRHRFVTVMSSRITRTQKLPLYYSFRLSGLFAGANIHYKRRLLARIETMRQIHISHYFCCPTVIYLYHIFHFMALQILQMVEKSGQCNSVCSSSCKFCDNYLKQSSSLQLATQTPTVCLNTVI